MKRIVRRIREVEKIENPLVELSALHTMITQIHQIISQRIRIEEASASENSYTPHTETDEEKSQRLVKQSIDDCIKELQNIQTRLMKYNRNEVSWYTKDSIEAMRRSIQSANRTIQTIIGDKEDQDAAFKKSPKDEDIRFAKWAIDSAYKVASMYSIEINKKLRLFNKEMVIDHPELKPLEIKNKEGELIGLFPLLIELLTKTQESFKYTKNRFRENEVKVGDSTIRLGLKVIFGRDGKYWTGKITDIYTMNRKEFYEVLDAVADDGEVKSFSYLRDKNISQIVREGKKGNGFITERENLRENEHFQEMAVLRKKRSGLPANLFLDDEGRWINSGHWKRIKFQPNRGDKAVSTNMVPMSIEDNPQILVKDAKIDLNSRELEQIKAFVKNNKELLLALGDQTIDIGEFLEKMKLEK